MLYIFTERVNIEQNYSSVTVFFKAMFKYITYKYATELCVAYGRSNHNQTEENTSFYRFPNNAVLRQKWINACKRANKDRTQWNPQGKNVYICGKHFISGKSSE